MNTNVLHGIRSWRSSYLTALKPRQIHLLALLIPTLIITSYRLLIETDRYASETQLVVMSSNSAVPDKLGLGLLVGGSAGHQDAKLVKEYIYSLDMLKFLQEKIQILDYYKSGHIDFFSSLSKRLTLDEALHYYQDHVHIKLDETSGVMTIEVEAFTAEFAEIMARTIVDRSEMFINQIDNGLARNRLEFVEKELQSAHEKMRVAKQSMVDFASKHGLVEPEAQSKSLVAVVNELNAELTRDEAQLKNLLSFMNPNAPDVVALRAKINAMKEQVRGEHGNFANNGDRSLATLTAQHQDLILAFTFSQDAYKTALAAMERARIDSFQKSKYLVKISNPDRPQYAKYPRRLRNLFSSLLVIFVIYGISVLVMEISREHRS